MSVSLNFLSLFPSPRGKKYAKKTPTLFFLSTFQEKRVKYSDELVTTGKHVLASKCESEMDIQPKQETNFRHKLRETVSEFDYLSRWIRTRTPRRRREIELTKEVDLVIKKQRERDGGGTTGNGLFARKKKKKKNRLGGEINKEM